MERPRTRNTIALTTHVIRGLSSVLCCFRSCLSVQETCRSRCLARLRAALITWSGLVRPCPCKSRRSMPAARVSVLFLLMPSSCHSIPRRRRQIQAASQPRSETPIRDADWSESRMGRPTTATIAVIPSLQRCCIIPNWPAEATKNTPGEAASSMPSQNLKSSPLSIPPKPRTRASPPSNQTSGPEYSARQTPHVRAASPLRWVGGVFAF